MAAVSKINHMVPNPSTERGVPAIISTHPTLNKVIYASGRSIIIRDLDNPLSCEVYREHNSLTTVAKFSHVTLTKCCFIFFSLLVHLRLI